MLNTDEQANSARSREVRSGTPAGLIVDDDDSTDDAVVVVVRHNLLDPLHSDAIRCVRLLSDIFH